MQTQHITYLLDRYLTGLLTEAEQQEWTALMQNPDHEGFVQSELVRLLGEEQEAAVPAADWAPVLRNVLSVDRTVDGKRRVFIIRRWMAAAAVVLVALTGTALYVLLRHRPTPQVVHSAPTTNPVILPGTNRATLTLANGQQIALDDAQNGVLSQQGKTKVIKLDSGKLAYAAAGEKEGSVPLYNTITTPRGGQYQITLPDGTRVWLNAESSLRFPTAFAGKEREVQLTGEGYFEVTPNKVQPFLVKAGQTKTQVLGTHFNIMAYVDEGPVKTTLLEGAVKVGDEGNSALLQPGEQGVFSKGTIATQTVNTRAVVAWKDGYYHFDRTPVQSVMRQIARWYDVDVVYKGAPPKDEIVGRIPRTAYVADVLHIMELIGIHFKIEGRTIIVQA